MTTPPPSLRQSLSQVFNRYYITFLLNAQYAGSWMRPNYSPAKGLQENSFFFASARGFTRTRMSSGFLRGAFAADGAGAALAAAEAAASSDFVMRIFFLPVFSFSIFFREIFPRGCR